MDDAGNRHPEQSTDADCHLLHIPAASIEVFRFLHILRCMGTMLLQHYRCQRMVQIQSLVKIHSQHQL